VFARRVKVSSAESATDHLDMSGCEYPQQAVHANDDRIDEDGIPKESGWRVLQRFLSRMLGKGRPTVNKDQTI